MIFINGKTNESLSIKESLNWETLYDKDYDMYALLIDNVVFTTLNKTQFNFIRLLVTSGEITQINSLEIQDKFITAQPKFACDINYNGEKHTINK